MRSKNEVTHKIFVHKSYIYMCVCVCVMWKYIFPTVYCVVLMTNWKKFW